MIFFLRWLDNQQNNICRETHSAAYQTSRHVLDKGIFLLIKKEKSKKEMLLLATCFGYIFKKQDLILIAFGFDCQEKDVIVPCCLSEVSFVFLHFKYDLAI